MTDSPIEEAECLSEKLSDQWVRNPSIIPDAITFKDFLPEIDPDRTTCFQKRYATFSETVEKANDWLAKHEGCEVVACESLPFNTSGSSNQLLDSWPTTMHLRGLRVWVRGGSEDELGTTGLKERSLLSYRDFMPRFNGKSMLYKKYEDVNVLLERVNSYLADRTTAATVLSLQSLDTPMDGVLDVGADTERSRLTFPQHGFTRYCRSLRLFSVTKYRRGHSTPPQPQPRIGIKDFTPTDSSTRISSLMQKAIKWCKSEQVSLMNLQVLCQRTGEHNTAVSSWMLESPGHIPNKFNSFVRIYYILPPGSYDLPEKTSLNMNGHAGTLGSEGNAENELKEVTDPEDVGDVPGVINTTTDDVTPVDSIDDFHFKLVAPKLVSSGNWCGGDEWEELDQVLGRLNSWVTASQGDVITVHTQYVYYSGDDVDFEETHYLRYMTGGQQMGVLHVLVSGGRPPTALPSPPHSERSSCAIM